MNADYDDAPYYLQRTRPRAAYGRWLLALMFGSLFSLSLLYFAGQSFNHPAQIAAPMPTGSRTPMPTPTPSPDSSPDFRNESVVYREAEIASTTVPLPAVSTPKQTVFNDQNYQPKQLVNTVSMPPAPTRSPPVAQRSGVVTGITEKRSVCWPLPEGSIEHRDCKGMVQLNTRNR